MRGIDINCHDEFIGRVFLFYKQRSYAQFSFVSTFVEVNCKIPNNNPTHYSNVILGNSDK